MTAPGWGDEWKAGAGDVSIAAIAAQGLTCVWGPGVGEEFMFRIAGITAGKAVGERFGDWALIENRS